MFMDTFDCKSFPAHFYSAEDIVDLAPDFISYRDRLKIANEELQKKKAYIDSLEPKVSSSGEGIFKEYSNTVITVD